MVEDNCCGCNQAAYSLVLGDYLPDVRLVYITYHVDVGETPFMVAVDFDRRAVVVSIRGTLSLKVRYSTSSPLPRGRKTLVWVRACPADCLIMCMCSVCDLAEERYAHFQTVCH